MVRVLGDEIVTIYIGKKRKKSLVRKKLICGRSEFFAKAFTSRFEEPKTGEMYLAENDENVFDSVIEWVYRGAFSTPVFDQYSQRVQTPDGKFASPVDPV